MIPASFRKRLGLKPGDEVVLELEDQEVRIRSQKEALRRAQEAVCDAVPADVSLVDELIAERRREARGD